MPPTPTPTVPVTPGGPGSPSEPMKWYPPDVIGDPHLPALTHAITNAGYTITAALVLIAVVLVLAPMVRAATHRNLAKRGAYRERTETPQ